MSECKNSLKDCLAFHSRDWSVEKRDAWLYGIILGWDEESLAELKLKHNWPDEQISRLKRLRAEFIKLCEVEEKPPIIDQSSCISSEEWISVEDTLPDEWQYVLLALHFTGNDEQKYVIHHGAYIGADKWDILGSTKTGTKKEGMIFGVTHWMPLPEPPESERANGIKE